MPPPNQHRVRRLPAHPVHNPQFLSHRQPLLHNGHTPLWADIHCVSLRPQRPSVLFPFHGQFHPRIQPNSGPNMLVVRPFHQPIKSGHSRLPPLNARRKPTAKQRAIPISTQQTHLLCIPPYLRPIPPSMELPLPFLLQVTPTLCSTSNATAKLCHPDQSNGAVCRCGAEGPWHELNPTTNLDGASHFVRSFFTSLPPPP
jgi:hypothetical protein